MNRRADGSSRGGKGAVIGLALLLVLAGGIALALWLTGVIGGGPRSADGAPPGNGSIAGNGMAASRPVSPPAPARAAAGGITRDYLIGTWGPLCPGQNEGSLEFRADGTVVSAQGVATWTLAGDRVTTVGGGVTESSMWTPQGPDSVAVNVPGVAAATLRRCPTSPF